MTEISRLNSDVIMSAMASQITSLLIVCSTVYAGADQRKHQSSASLAFVWVTQRWPVNFPHKWPVIRKMFPFDDATMVLIGRPLYIIHTQLKLKLDRATIYFSNTIYTANSSPWIYNVRIYDLMETRFGSSSWTKTHLLVQFGNWILDDRLCPSWYTVASLILNSNQ